MGMVADDRAKVVDARLAELEEAAGQQQQQQLVAGGELAELVERSCAKSAEATGRRVLEGMRDAIAEAIAAADEVCARTFRIRAHS